MAAGSADDGAGLDRRLRFARIDGHRQETAACYVACYVDRNNKPSHCCEGLVLSPDLLITERARQCLPQLGLASAYLLSLTASWATYWP